MLIDLLVCLSSGEGEVVWAGDAVMGAVGTADVFELARCPEQVSLVPDQGAVRQLATAGPHPPFHDRIHARHPYSAEYCLDLCIIEDGVEQGGKLPVPVPNQEPGPPAGASRSMPRFFATCVTQDAVGGAVASRTWTRRLACSITAHT
jgi:hypothetical protein